MEKNAKNNHTKKNSLILHVSSRPLSQHCSAMLNFPTSKKEFLSPEKEKWGEQLAF